MRLDELFEGYVDIHPAVKRDWRQALLLIADHFHGKFEPIEHDGKKSNYYLSLEDNDQMIELRIELNKLDNDASIYFQTFGEKRQQFATFRKLQREFEALTEVSNVVIHTDGGQFRATLPFTKR